MDRIEFEDKLEKIICSRHEEKYKLIMELIEKTNDNLEWLFKIKEKMSHLDNKFCSNDLKEKIIETAKTINDWLRVINKYKDYEDIATIAALRLAELAGDDLEKWKKILGYSDPTRFLYKYIKLFKLPN